MSGETVVYQNEMNLVPLRKFTSTEIDIFFSLCNKLKEQDIKEVSISFEELRHLSNYYHRSQKRFVKDLELWKVSIEWSYFCEGFLLYS